MSDKKNTTQTAETTTPEDTKFSFSGRYFSAVGRRKTSIAQVRIYEDKRGLVVVNGHELSKYFPTQESRNSVVAPLVVTGLDKEFSISIHVTGGGLMSQSEASRLGVARTLLKYNADLRPALKPHGFLTRDPRKKERKKPGLKRARRAPQWSKR